MKVTSKPMHGKRDQRTLDDIVVASFDCDIRHAHKLELRVVFVVEVVEEPAAFLDIAHGAANMVAFVEKRVDDVATNEAVHTRHEDGGTGLDRNVGHN